MLGGTDSRYYSDICENVYRFGSFLSEGNWGPAHAANEWQSGQYSDDRS